MPYTNPEVRIEYFVPDKHKSGRSVIEISSEVKKKSVIDATIRKMLAR